MSATQVTNLVTGLHGVHVYDKELFEGVAANVAANFSKFDTEQVRLNPFCFQLVNVGLHAAFGQIAGDADTVHRVHREIYVIHAAKQTDSGCTVGRSVSTVAALQAVKERTETKASVH